MSSFKNTHYTEEQNLRNEYNRRRVIQGASVQVRNGDVNGALRKLKKILDNDNRQKDLARHEFHEKNSVKRKRAKDQAKKRYIKDRQKNEITGINSTNTPSGLKWMKSKRKRRKVLDRETALANIARQSVKNRG